MMMKKKKKIMKIIKKNAHRRLRRSGTTSTGSRAALRRLKGNTAPFSPRPRLTKVRNCLQKNVVLSFKTYFECSTQCTYCIKPTYFDLQKFCRNETRA